MTIYEDYVIDKVKKLKPSQRGELEITDLNNLYIKNHDCEIVFLEKDCVWFDSGTFGSLLNASIYVKENIII